jgi:hypothetical protein
MTVDKKIRKIWRELYEHGDIQRASDETGLAELTISRAINNGKCSNTTFKKLNEFFLNKKKTKAAEVENVVKQFADNN